MASSSFATRRDALADRVSGPAGPLSLETLIMERVFEELQLISCSLLPGEVLTFLEDCDGWTDALHSYGTIGYHESLEKLRLASPSFRIGLEDFNVWFETSLSLETGTWTTSQRSSVSVKGEDISRAQQETWQDTVKEKLEEIGDSE